MRQSSEPRIAIQAAAGEMPGQTQGRGGEENQQAPAERAANRDPSGGWRNAETEAENEVRPGGETLGIRIKKQNRERDGRKFQRERVQLPRGEHEERRRDQSEHPGEADG